MKNTAVAVFLSDPPKRMLELAFKEPYACPEGYWVVKTFKLRGGYDRSVIHLVCQDTHNKK
jgi:hypothetical protein